MKRIIEIKAGEGGMDARLFAREVIAAAYIKFANRVG